MLSITFTVACVVAIVVILSQIDGKPLSSWSLHAVSPNAIISTLSTAAKAAMILPVAESISQLKWLYLARQTLSLRHMQAFDDASRGPWGALRFFFRSKSFWRRGAFVPFIGCVVTIAALATDPFTQQVLSFEEASTLVAGARSVAVRSQNYDWEGKGLNGVGSVLSSTRDGLLTAASASGLYDLVAAPPLTCPGSNCTYPDFTSLGIRSQCRDVTADTKQSCREFKNSLTNQVCSYTLPGGFQLGSYAGADAHNGFYHTRINGTYTNMLYKASDAATLAAVAVVRFDDADLEGNFDVSTKWQATLEAWECEFGIVAYTYAGWASRNGTVHPGRMTASPLNRTSATGPLVPYEVVDKDFRGNTSAVINYYDMINMASMIGDIFTTAGTIAAFSSALYDSPNLTATAGNIARGMSYRMLAGPNSTEVYGDVYAVRTYMRVHWRWLALMATLVVITVAFFVAVVVQTRLEGQRAWKSSLVPMLFGGHEALVGGGGKVGVESEEAGSGDEEKTKESVRVTDRGGGVWEVPEEYHIGRTRTILTRLG
jgi:hypothetical protein